MHEQSGHGWNRRRFLGAAIGSLAITPVATRGEEKELPSCSRKGRHGPWRISADSSDYQVGRDIEGEGVGDVEIVTYTDEDGTIEPRQSTVTVRRGRQSHSVYATVPKHFRTDRAEFELGTPSDDTTVHISRQEDTKAFPFAAMLLVDGREIAAGDATSVSPDYFNTIDLNLNWSTNPAQALKKGRKGVLLLHNGRGNDVRKELIRFPIDLSGFTAASRKGAELHRAASEEADAGRCSDASCYLTTACCEHLGRPDACWELRTLRWYRDHCLTAQADGPAALATYYREAPAIVAALPPRGLRRACAIGAIYWGTVIPCALLVRCGAYRLARIRYERGFRRLRARWLPD